jgi:hypothetical protein
VALRGDPDDSTLVSPVLERLEIPGADNAALLVQSLRQYRNLRSLDVSETSVTGESGRSSHSDLLRWPSIRVARRLPIIIAD